MKKLSAIFLAVVIAVVSVVPAFAKDYNGYDLPDFDKAISSYLKEYPYVSLHYDIPDSKTSFKLYLSKEPMMLMSISNGIHMFSTVSGDVEYVRFKYSTTSGADDWSSPYISHDPTVYNDIVWSNYDITYFDGLLYKEGYKPPKPLVDSIVGLYGDTINNETVPTVLNTMTTLGIVGAGLLAMFVSVRLISKRIFFKG